MKNLFSLVVILVVGIAVLGFFRGWFQVSTGNSDNRPSATITVDKDKIHADEEKAKEKARGFEQEAKEKLGDRTGKADEPERRR